MSERYSKLFSLPENLYSTGSPVVIAAGALLKDTETGNVLAQLKLQSLSGKMIKAATVTITPYDTVGTPLGNALSHQYLDLNTERDSNFGSKVPIILPNASTRSFTATVDEVIFKDNTIWTFTGEPWESLSKPKPLSALQDRELIKQFRLTYGQSCENLLLEEKDLWHCTCNSLNRVSEFNCHVCQNSLDTLRAFDPDELARARDTRLQKEKENQARAAQEAEEHRRKAVQKTKKIAKIAIPAAIVLILIIFVANNIIIPSTQYKEAEALLAAEDYNGALAIFRELGDYKDSEQRAKESYQLAQDANLAAENEALYQQAVQTFESGKYEEAYHQFQEILEYKDVSTYLEQIVLLPVEFTSTNSIDMTATFYLSYDENGVMTDAYLGDDKRRQATFDENGRVIRLEGDASYLYSDGSGANQLQENDFWYTFTYNADGSVTSTKMPDDVIAAQYDEHGNITTAYIDGKEFSREDELVDSHNNRYSGAKNNYSDDGHLISVKNLLRSDADTIEFLYVVLYDPDLSIDEDLIWKNIRIMFGEDIW